MERENHKEQLTDLEFDVLDELYFVSGFDELAETLAITESDLKNILKELIQKKYVKWLFPDPDTEADFSVADFEGNFRKSYFLATKAGLLKHNSR